MRQIYRNIFHVILLGMMLAFSSKINANQILKTTNLRTEYKTNPLGIDIEKPRLSWEIVSNKRSTMQISYEVSFATTKDNLIEENEILWTIKDKSDQSIHIIYNGPKLQSRQRIYWRVRVWDNHGRVSEWSKPAFWEMGLLNKSDWKAKWIEADLVEDTTASQPAQYFRKEFNLEKSVKSARLYITSHGLYESFINNNNVGEEVYTPGWTSYKKRLQYQVYDISNMIDKGINTIGITLGDGWYRGYLTWTKGIRNYYGPNLGTIAQLEILFDDGSEQTIITGDGWKSTNKGPIIKSDIYNGETYDARKKINNWKLNNFDDSDWSKVNNREFPNQNLVASNSVPVKRLEEIKPIKIINKEEGKYIFDFGQNMVGTVRLKVKGKKGTTIKLQCVEVLDKKGNIVTENLRAAEQQIAYTFKGDEKEIYEPHFSFQGFRFVEITGYKHVPTLETLTGIVIYSDMTPTGNFVCSDSLITKLQKNIQWGLKGNFLDVPTDCPQRDERLGWTGDAQVFAPTACFNVDAAMFYTKWLKDLALDQRADGRVPDVIPDVLDETMGGHTGWGDAAVVIPWTVYQNYGDVRILEEQYKSMKAWIAYMQGRAGDNYLWENDGHYGDWLSFDASSAGYMGAYTETDLIATIYFAYSTNLMRKIALIVGKKEDANRFSELFEKIKIAFTKEFITPNGRLVSHTQTAYTLALSMDLIPEELKKEAAKNLIKNVNRFKHITTGFLGTPLINQTLTDVGSIETAYMLLTRKEFPSWLYPITMGATTIWERWDGIKPDSTFQNQSMNSFNHYAYGAIGKWLYSTVAGINLDEDNPGYKKIIINPNSGGGLTNAKAEINTIYGYVSSGWEIKNNKMIMNITIPPNTTAEIYFPTDNINNISENGKTLSEQEETKILKVINGKQVVRVGSGEYQFEVVQ